MTHDFNGNTIKNRAIQVIEVVRQHEEEERQVRLAKQRMEEDIEMSMKELSQLEMEKSKLDGEITALKLRDTAYQREHLDLRNAISLIKFKIEKIKDSIEETKKTELEDLREFERAVDEITEKFRSSPAVYDRRSLSQKLDEEREKRKLLLENIQEMREAYANFNREKGLRERSNEDEELLNCALPGSELYCLMEMTKNLDEVIGYMRHRTKDLNKKADELEEVPAHSTEVSSKMAAATVNPKNDEEN